MHVHLTDVLSCPRCGPEFGLVLLADRVEERRVLEGWLGCPNCRERYRVSGGLAELSYGPAVAAAGAADEAAAMRLAALLGVTEGPGMVLTVGSGAGQAERIAGLVPGIEVIAAAGSGHAATEVAGVSRISVGARLPFRDRCMNGVALTDAASPELVDEAVRVAAPRARVVVHSGSDSIAERLEKSGLRIMARDGDTMVAQRGVI